MLRFVIVLFLMLELNTEMLYSRGRKSSILSSKRKASGSRGRGIGGRVPANHQYHVGAKGGCYYVDGNGKKQYVERSKCE
jgi:hypothetical protein